MPYFHQVARLRPRTLNLLEPVLAPRVWRSLRRTFPLALLVVLMPTHVHLILEALIADELRREAARALARAVRGLGKHTWEPLPPPELLRDRGQLRKNLRYVALNPCRWGLVGDPLGWLWSTYRDLFGASSDAWIDVGRLAGVLGEAPVGFPERWHRYVSSDRSVAEEGTPPPIPPDELVGLGPVHGLQDMLDACARALRRPPSSILADPTSRRTFLGLARHRGWNDTEALARFTGLSRRTIERGVVWTADTDLDAALACLAEPRFRIAPVLGRPPRGNPFAQAARSSARPLWD